ncbi:protein XAP5 CIRCADIAN TIMEKEEPER isoform X2 [Setaria italica]|uniref:protein XAP5 CIRCADIAN TIMEKEEPER isoform X2 n=1 Tax=Setaria italica TaxID=4555 RepID=UPI000BE5819C|nr:protein XAP5 CIRCADIAN TIMEKEEPER isoform X2 [Setaria italica]
MSGFGDGYVGMAQDAVKIRQLEKQREAERRKIEKLKNKSSDGQPGLLQFGSSTSEVATVHAWSKQRLQPPSSHQEN